MFYNPQVYTVESVTAGHPDKVCDQISDAIVDACLAQDSQSRVAVECFGSHGLLVIGGEVTTQAKVDYAALARRVYQGIGYTDTLRIEVNIIDQSPDIAQGVDTGGAGDQGVMYGYATSETPEFLPKGVVLAHRLTQGLDDLRKTGKVSWLRPDGKSQITIRNEVVDTVLVSTQHDTRIPLDEVRRAILEELIRPVIGSGWGDTSKTRIIINPAGTFVLGGFAADTGLTGRKIMVDTYGGLIPHGGGCFSGKDATKVDRSGAYMARFVAKDVVARGLSNECLVSVAYAIGQAKPVMVEAIGGMGEDLSEEIRTRFDFRPQAIIELLNLRRPIYQQTAVYGHFK